MVEIDTAEIDITEIDIAENIFNSWLTCKNNHTYIENISETELIFSNNIKRDGKVYSYDKNIDTLKRTIYIENCDNLDVRLLDKFNHVVIVNSRNIIVRLENSLLSGLGVFGSKNVTVRVSNKKINYSEVSNSENCVFVFDSNSSENIYINTNLCYNTTFIITDFYIFKRFVTDESLFGAFELYHLNDMSLHKLC